MTGAPARASRAVLLACLTIMVVGVAATVVIVLTSQQDRSLLGFLPVTIAYGVVGVMIVARRPGSVVGWLFVVSGVGGSVGLLCKAIGSAAVPLGAQAPTYAVWAAWFSLIYVELVALPYVYLFLLFPDGRFISRRWRWVGIAACVLMVGSATIVALSDQNFAHSRSGNPNDLNFPGMVHPLQLLPAEPFGVFYNGLLGPLTIGILALSVAALVVRWRRSVGIERQQLRWFLLASIVAVTGFTLTALFAPNAITVAFSVLFPLVPIACGVAILQYHLYDIDRLISRTVSYVVVTGLAFALYVGVVSATTTLVPGRAPSWTVAAATLVAAAAFRPLLRRVRATVDRRFDRRHVDAVAAVESFGRRVGERADPDTTLADLLDVIDETLAPTSTAVLRLPGPS